MTHCVTNMKVIPVHVTNYLKSTLKVSYYAPIFKLFTTILLLFIICFILNVILYLDKEYNIPVIVLYFHLVSCLFHFDNIHLVLIPQILFMCS